MIETKIQPKDIGFPRDRMKAVVKLTIYDAAMLKVRLSASTQMPLRMSWATAFTLSSESEQKITLPVCLEEEFFLIIPGMRTHVDIITKDKTFMAYPLKPILRTKQSALTER